MIKIIGVEYLTEKEASHRYGYSIAWFRKQRNLHVCPKFTRLGTKTRGRVYYPLVETDNWFKMQLENNSL